MYNMFSGEVSGTRQQRETGNINADVIIESNFSDETLKELKIGKLVQTTMKSLFKDEKITQDEIDKMTQDNYSKQVLNANIPVLK